MKKIVFLLTVFCIPLSSLFASHREILDAGNIISGTLNDGRLSSNVLLKDTTGTITAPYTFSSSATFNTLIKVSSLSIAGTVTSSSTPGFIGDGSKLTGIVTNALSGGASTYASFDATALSTAALFGGSATTYVTLDGSTQTKTGGLMLGGGFQASSGTFTNGLRSTGSGLRSTVLGLNASATGTDATALGNAASATNSQATAIGISASASNTDSTALGESSLASGSASTALGYLTTGSGSNSIAAGNSATASNTNTVAVGQSASAGGNGSVALGNIATANGTNSIAIGNSSVASGTNSIAIGISVVSSSRNSVTLGENITNNISSSVMMGVSNTNFRLLVSSNSVNLGDPSFRGNAPGLNVDRINSSSITAAQINSTNPYVGSGALLTNTIGVNDGTTVGSVRALKFTGAGNGGITISGDTATLTMLDTTGGGGGTVSIATVPISLKFPGDIYQATSPFVAVSGGLFSTGRGTFNVINVEVSLVRPSTISATFFYLAKSTVTDMGIAFSTITAAIVVTTGSATTSNYSNLISTSFVCNAQERYAIQVSSTADPLLGGNPASEAIMTLWGWWNKFSP